MTTKPSKQIVPLATALTWTGGGLVQVKLDGVFATLATVDGLLAGENVGGLFTAFDCLEWRGADVRLLPLIERLAMRDELCRAGQIPVVRETTERGGELLQCVLGCGGEGAVFKRMDSTWFEPMLAAKRSQDFICRVSDCGGGRQSVAIADSATGQPRGRVGLFGGRADRVRVGSVLKITGFGLTERGLIREPRPDKDTAESWLIHF